MKNNNLRLVGEYDSVQDIYLGALDAERNGSSVTHIFTIDNNGRQRYTGSQFSKSKPLDCSCISMDGLEKVARIIAKSEGNGPVKLNYEPRKVPTKEEILQLNNGQESISLRGLNLDEIFKLRSYQGLPELRLAA